MRIGVGLSIPELATRGGRAFSPLSLFTAGVQGAWYDPSDINSYMSGLGSELVTNGDFASGSTGWSGTGSAVLSVVSGQLRVENGAVATAGANQTISTVAGRWYRFDYYVDPLTATSVVVRARDAVSLTVLQTTTQTVAGAYTVYFAAIGTTTQIQSINSNATLGLYHQIDNISVKEVTTISNATLFQDSAGTTPVTAVEQPVGLMLDKSIDQSFVDVTGAVWTRTAGDGVLSVVGDTITVTGATTATQITRTAGSISLVPGLAKMVIRADWTTATSVSAWLRGSPTVLSNGVTQTIIKALNNSTLERLDVGTGTVTFTISQFQYWRGNHAFQATTASRPVLRARYNLLTYSEQFDNAAWTKSFVTLSANAAVAPDGTTTADLIYPTTGTYRGVYQRPTLASGIFVTTIYAKAAGKSWVAFVDFGGGQNRAWANVSTGAVGTVNAGYSLTITPAQNGWYRLDFTQTAAASNPYLWISVCDADNTNTGTTNGTDGIYIWGADLRTGSSAGTYQRIAAATDYATAGFLPYLDLITDDSFGTNSIDFSATNKMSVCAGVTKLSDAAVAILVELSATTTSNAGSFYLSAPETTGASGDFGANVRGTTTPPVLTSGTVLSPATRVLTGLFDIAAPSRTMRLNGTQVATNSTTMNGGNFGNYPLYIGRRNNASLPLNGRIYQMIVVGKTLSASELASTEAFVNTKTGAY